MSAHDLELLRVDVLRSSERLWQLCIGVPTDYNWYAVLPDAAAKALEDLQHRRADLRIALLTGTSLNDFKLAYPKGVIPPWVKIKGAMLRAAEQLLEADRALDRRVRELQLSA